MNQVKSIERFVDWMFDLYQAEKQEFYYEYDEDAMKMVEKPLFVTGEVEYETINKLSLFFGIDEQSIINRDENAAKRYWEKYSFFRLFKEYMTAWAFFSRYEEPSFESACTEDECNSFELKKRYDYLDIKNRLLTKIKELDEVIPGTYHKGAEITDLSIRTEVFFSFPKCSEMIKSLIILIERIQALYYKALFQTLDDEEIRELNFLASWLRAGDAVMPDTLITYNNILKYRDVYAEECRDMPFCDCVKIRRFGALDSSFIPWRCKEFFNDMDTVRKFASFFPGTKAKMREFEMLLANFHCWFTWSDAKPIMYSPEEEQEISEFLEMIGEEDIPIEERAKEPTEIYLNKEDCEMPGWGPFLDRLRIAASPEKKGGLKTNSVNLLPESVFRRLTKRIEIRHNGVYNE